MIRYDIDVLPIDAWKFFKETNDTRVSKSTAPFATIFKSRRVTRIRWKMKFLQEEAGVEPTALKIMAGVILLAIGLGIGVAVYRTVGTGVSGQLSFSVDVQANEVILGIPDNGENSTDVQVSVDRILDYNKVVTLSYSPSIDNVNITFNPPNGTPNFGSTMTIKVDNTAIPENITITVQGSDADGLQKTDTFILRIV